MTKSSSEDTILFCGLLPELTDMTTIYENLTAFFKKKHSIDPSDRFNFILFNDDGPESFSEFTSKYEMVLNALKSLEHETVKTNIASVIFVALPLIIEVFKKIGNKCYRLITISEPNLFEIPDDFQLIIEELVDMIKTIPFFFDIIIVNNKNTLVDSKIANLARLSKGKFYEIKDISELSDILSILAEKKETEPVKTINIGDNLVYEENQAFFRCFDNAAMDPLELNRSDTCSVCFEKEDKDLIQCPVCETIAHRKCWAEWAKNSHIGIHHVFRCHNCHNLMKLDEKFILEVQFGVKSSPVQEIKLQTTFPKETEVEIESKVEQHETHASSKDITEQQVETTVKDYLIIKSKTNKKITRINTLSAIKESLNLKQDDTYWDEIIWAFAKYLCKGMCIKRTDNTIIFRE